MNIKELKIEYPMAPTEKMKDSGIFGTFALSIVTDIGVLATLRELTIRKNGTTGELFIAVPSRAVEKNGEKKYYSYFNLYPGLPNRDELMKGLLDKARQAINGASNVKKNTTPSNPVKTNSTAEVDPF